MRRKGLPNYWDLHFQSLMKSFEIWKIKREKKKLEKELKEKNPELYAVIFGMKNDIENLANKNLNKEKDSGKKSTRTTKRTKH
jgi:hypothetical protein